MGQLLEVPSSGPPDKENPLITNPPTAEETELILANRGADERDISLLVFGTPWRTVTVRDVVSNPERYDPVVDEVAVRRAMDGDREVWQNLTHHERRQVLLLVKARWDDDRAEEEWTRELFGKSTLGRNGSPWLADLAADWGMSRTQLVTLIFHLSGE